MGRFWADGWVDVGFGSVGPGLAYRCDCFLRVRFGSYFKVFHIQHPYNIIHFCTQVRAGREKYFFQLIMLWPLSTS